MTNAWTFVNDSLATNICLIWEPEIIAIAMLFMSFKMTRMEMGIDVEEEDKLEEEDDKGNWWEAVREFSLKN